MNRILISAASMLALTAGMAQAQDGAQDDATTLETLYVTTPLRRESSLEKSTSSVIVIDEEEIRRSAALDLPSLLRGYPGVSVTTYGGMGSTSDVQLRGMSSAQTLVLVNGVRVASATSGTASLFNIPLASIERIEIAKGPHSVQYGADALGGVINIITKQGGSCGNGNNVCGSVTAGVMHPWGGTLSGNVRGSADGLDYAVGGSLLGTRGYDFTYPTAWGHEPDDDGFLQGAANFSIGKELGWGRLYAEGLFASARSQYDAVPSAWDPGFNEVDTTTFSGKIGARIDHAHDWVSTLEFSGSTDRRRNFRKGTPGSDNFNSTRYGVFGSTQKTFETDAVSHILLGGFEAYHESVQAPAAYAVTSRSLAAGFAQYSAEYGALSFDSGVRYDHNQQFGDATTYNVGASYQILPELIARASYGTGFRAPSFDLLYYPGYANPNLRPERSETYEVGLKWIPSVDTTLDLAFYQTWVRDLIVSPPPNYIPYNVGRAKVTGFEASVSHAFNARWRGKASFDVRSSIDSDTGLFIPHRDRFKATAELGFAATDQLDLAAKLIYVAARHSNAANTAMAPDYVTVDLSADYRFNDRSSLKFSVENLFDKEYSTRPDYRSPGRTIHLSLTHQF